jgi:uroporphyrinogen decarboxylase
VTRRERVRSAIAHRQPDRTPWQVELTGEVAARLAATLGLTPGELDEWAGNHCAKVSLSGGSLSADGEIFRDDYGVEWDRSGLDRDIGIIREPLLRSPDLSGFRTPEIDADAIRRKLDAYFASPPDRFVFAKIGTTLFERAWSLTGLEEFLVYLLTEPAFVAELLALIADHNERLAAIALEYPVDGLYVGDDYGQQSGLIMSPAMWREYFLPHLARLFSQVHAQDAVNALHSCGKIDSILDDLVDAGLDVYQTVQPEVYDLAWLKSRWGDRLSFWGGISTQRDLPFRAAREIREITRETVEVLGRDGGYIAGPTHRVPADVPDETICAVVEVLRDGRAN